MIGQDKILEKINILIQTGFPRFLIITGAKGQGKTELAKYIVCKLDNYYKDELADKGGCYMIEVGTKIDEIREMIQMAYKQTEPVIYLIQNADKMSIGAKNSLLKVIEEPPNNAYFIMELQQIENTLPTIKSRCQEIKLDEYTYDEKMKMVNKLKPDAILEEVQILNKLDNYYQMQKVLEYNPVEFMNYIDKVYNNIYKVQSANSFKIPEKVDIKGDGNGYDLELFWIMYINRCLADLFDLMSIPADEQDWEDAKIPSKCIDTTYKYKQELKVNGINKQMLMDNWILDIRKIWR